jgi:glycosyltransferase involved in cell wall biosynthesis
MDRIKPLLSLCLPTFNRARLLEQALESLLPQMISAGSRVELVVCDNCSPDDTQDVIQRFKTLMPMRTYRNDSNIGAASNILRLTNDLASGEFAWIICDDDLMHPKGLSTVLDVLDKNPDIDYMFVNVAARPADERMKFITLLGNGDIPDFSPPKCKDASSRPITHFETFVDQSFDDALLGSVMVHVFRLSRWKKHPLALSAPSNDMFNLAMVYPHCIILANTMANARCFYLAQPCILTFWGEQEWKGMVPYMITVHFHDLLDYYQQCGISKKQIRKCRRRLLLSSAPALRSLLFNRDIPGRKRFSLKHFIFRNIRQPFLLLALPLIIATHSFLQHLRKLTTP